MLTAAVALIVISTGACTATEVPLDPTTWYGLGVKECYGETCQLDQFCSDNSIRGKGCRNCSEIISSWCPDDGPMSRSEEFRHRLPSCEAMCVRNRAKKLEKKNMDLEERNQQMNIALKDAVSKYAQLEGELNATGLALQKTLEASKQDEITTLRGQFLQLEQKLNETDMHLKNAQAAESKKEEELEKLRNRLDKAEHDLYTTKDNLKDAEGRVLGKADELETMGNERDNLESENQKLRKQLEQLSDQVQSWQIATAVFGSSLIFLLIIIIWRCAKLWRKKTRISRRNQLNTPICQGNQPGLRQSAGDPAQHPLLSGSPAAHTTTTINIPIADKHSGSNNLSTSNNSIPIPSTTTNAGSHPATLNNIQPASDTEDGRSCTHGTPYSSDSSLSDQLAPSGQRTEQHLDDQKDFFQTSNL